MRNWPDNWYTKESDQKYMDVAFDGIQWFYLCQKIKIEIFSRGIFENVQYEVEVDKNARFGLIFLVKNQESPLKNTVMPEGEKIWGATSNRWV